VVAVTEYMGYTTKFTKALGIITLLLLFAWILSKGVVAKEIIEEPVLTQTNEVVQEIESPKSQVPSL
jgi:hypothetical protein